MKNAAAPAFLRMMDANANRAMEGLRVCEDICRFAFDSSGHYRHLRKLRHNVALAVSRLPVARKRLLASRASASDVGRKASPSRIRSAEEMLLINFQRVKESLRVLEECSRLVSLKQAKHFQQLRFMAYECERDCLLSLETVRHHR